MKIHFLHLVALCCSILTMGGCTADLSEDSENDLTTDDEELQEGAPNALGADEDTENIGEVSQQVVLKSYSASNTNNALNGANVAKISVSLDGNETVMIGTAGLKGASTQGDTFLRLGAPTGDLIANAVNDDYLCGGSYQLGSRLVYTSSYNVLKSFTIWAGCFANDSCGGTTVVSRRKGHFQYSANNTDHGRQGPQIASTPWLQDVGFAPAHAASRRPQPRTTVTRSCVSIGRTEQPRLRSAPTTTVHIAPQSVESGRRSSTKCRQMGIIRFALAATATLRAAAL